MNTQYKLLKTIAECERNGQSLEKDIFEKWNKCPPREVILNLGNDELFVFNLDFASPAYTLTWQGREYIREYRASVRNTVISILTLVVAVVTLAVSLG